jgi:hypothetical protein
MYACQKRVQTSGETDMSSSAGCLTKSQYQSNGDWLNACKLPTRRSVRSTFYCKQCTTGWDNDHIHTHNWLFLAFFMNIHIQTFLMKIIS